MNAPRDETEKRKEEKKEPNTRHTPEGAPVVIKSAGLPRLELLMSEEIFCSNSFPLFP